jgi:thiol-disulfide isomerase/thioredoxin
MSPVAKQHPRSRRPAGGDRPPGDRQRRRPSAQTRRPWWRGPWGLATAAAAIVVIVVGIVAAGRSSTTAPGGASTTGEQPVPAGVLAAVTAPNAGVLAAVADGGVANPLKPIGSASPLTGAGSKPVVLYIGADYCPYCAAERWSLILALSRFGTFSNLHLMTSSSTDVYPNTPTFTFYGSSYSGPYLDLQTVETENRDLQPLQTPTAAQQQVFATYDAPPYSSTAAGIPFIDIANQQVEISSGYSPGLLDGLTWSQIASQLSVPTAAPTQAIAGNANWLTAAICRATGNQPGSVCSAAPIPQLEAQLGGGAGS